MAGFTFFSFLFCFPLSINDISNVKINKSFQSPKSGGLLRVQVNSKLNTVDMQKERVWEFSVVQTIRLVGPRPKRFRRAELPKNTTSQEEMTEVNSNTRAIKSETNKLIKNPS